MPTDSATPIVAYEKVSVRRQLLADAALAGLTVVWGTSFVLVKDILEQVSPMLFLAARFGLASLSLALITLLMKRWRGLTMRELRWGVFIGVVLWAGYALQTMGLHGEQRTSASNAGFITGLSVVMVPIIGLYLLRQRPHRWALAGVALATIGLGLLSLRLEEGQGVALTWGDALVLGCAVAFAFHIVLLSRVAQWADPLRMSLVQVSVAGLLNGFSALVFERPVATLAPEIWAGAAFLGILATGLAIATQVAVQRFTTAVHTALIFTLEPVFASMFGVWLQGDRLGPVALTGAALILGGMLVAELGPQMRALARYATTRPQRNPTL